MNQRLTTLALGTSLLAAADGSATTAQAVDALGLNLLRKASKPMALKSPYSIQATCAMTCLRGQ